MSEVGVEYSALVAASNDWSDLAEKLSTTSTELSGASTAGLAPDVASAGRSFLQAWSGFASESADIATGLSEALTAASQSYGSTDDGAQGDFSDLDGRLGPAT